MGSQALAVGAERQLRPEELPRTRSMCHSCSGQALRFLLLRFSCPLSRAWRISVSIRQDFSLTGLGAMNEQ